MKKNGNWLGRCFGVVLVAAASTFILGIAGSSAAPVEDSTAVAVALAGSTAPSAGNPTFIFFDEPMVDSRGDVVFGADLSDTKTGIFLKLNKKSASVSLISATNAAIPGVGTPNFFDGPAMSSNGNIAFVAGGTSGVAGVTAAVLRRTFKKSSLEVVAKTGDIAPGTGGAVFAHFDDLAVNNKGHVAFIADYTKDAGVTFDAGVFLSTNRGILPILLHGDSLPGTGGTNDASFAGDIDGPWLNNNDDVAFAVDVINAAVPLEGSVFLKQLKKPIQPLLLMGSTLLGGTISSIGVGRPGLSDGLDLLPFSAEVTGGTVGSAVGVIDPKKGPKLCARQGDPAPDTTGTFNTLSGSPFGNPTISGNTMEFHSELLGDGSNPQGIFTCAKANSGKVSLREAVLPSDPKPVGSWGIDLEEDSSSSRWVVFDDEDSSPGPIGVFITKTPGPEPKNDKN